MRQEGVSSTLLSGLYNRPLNASSNINTFIGTHQPPEGLGTPNTGGGMPLMQRV